MSKEPEVSGQITNFVSGSLLGWVVLLIGLRSRVATLPIGRAFKCDWTGVRPPNEMLHFVVLCSVLALGLSVTILAVAHLVSRGLRLAVNEGDNSGKSLAPFAQYTYEGVFFVSKLALYYLLLRQLRGIC